LGSIDGHLLPDGLTIFGIFPAIVQIEGGEGEARKRYGFNCSGLDEAELEVSFSRLGFIFHGLKIDSTNFSFLFIFSVAVLFISFLPDLFDVSVVATRYRDHQIERLVFEQSNIVVSELAVFFLQCAHGNGSIVEI